MSSMKKRKPPVAAARVSVAAVTHGVPDLRIEMVAIADVQPWAANARLHPDHQVAQIAASIAEFGFVNPVLLDADGVLVAGHGRLLAASRLGLASVPVIRLGHLTSAQARALRIADNRIALNSGWDPALLGLELARIRDEAEVDLGILGFPDLELDRLLQPPDATEEDPDDVPEPPPTAVSRTGDLWLCGHHRVLCGDAGSAADRERVLAGGRAAMCFTDPPYNVAYEGRTSARMRIANDDHGTGFAEFLRPALANILSVTDGGCYVCMSSSEWPTLHRAWQEAGGRWSNTIIWTKSAFTLGRGDYHHQHEPILYGWREGASHYWCGARDQGNVWAFDRPSRNGLHPTMKPVALVERAIRNSSRRGEVVLDPFGGSGTTLIAAERTGRRAALLELDPRFCDVIVQRWQRLTGRAALLDGADLSFTAVALERAAGLGLPDCAVLPVQGMAGAPPA